MKITSSVPFHKDNLTRLLDWLGWNPTSRLEIVIHQNRTGYQVGASGRAWARRRRVFIKVCSRFTRARPPRIQLARPQQQGYLGVLAYSFVEDFVYVLAHELRHIDQLRNGRYGPRDPLARHIRRKVMGTNACLREVDASRYGIQKMRAFRREFPSDFKLTV